MTRSTRRGEACTHIATRRTHSLATRLGGAALHRTPACRRRNGSRAPDRNRHRRRTDGARRRPPVVAPGQRARSASMAMRHGPGSMRARVAQHGWIAPYVKSALGQPTGPLYLTAAALRDSCRTRTFTLRFSMALFGIATIPLAYFAFRSMFGRTVAAFAALLLAVMTWHLHLTRTGFMVARLAVHRDGRRCGRSSPASAAAACRCSRSPERSPAPASTPTTPTCSSCRRSPSPWSGRSCSAGGRRERWRMCPASLPRWP